MAALFEERWPGGRLVDVAADPRWQDEVEPAATLVLLYPDAIGIGFSSLERRVRSLKSPRAELRVLNGRRRELLLNGATRRSLALRRLLERSMLVELCATAVVTVATPPLALIDRRRGHR